MHADQQVHRSPQQEVGKLLFVQQRLCDQLTALERCSLSISLFEQPNKVMSTRCWVMAISPPCRYWEMQKKKIGQTINSLLPILCWLPKLWPSVPMEQSKRLMVFHFKCDQQWFYGSEISKTKLYISVLNYNQYDAIDAGLPQCPSTLRPHVSPSKSYVSHLVQNTVSHSSIAIAMQKATPRFNLRSFQNGITEGFEEYCSSIANH